MKTIQWAGVLVLCAVLCLPAWAAPAPGAGNTGQGAGSGAPFAPVIQEARLARIALLTAIADARMEGTITYIGEISSGAGTAELSALRGDFSAVSAGLMQDTTRADVQRDRAALLRVRDEFRNETRLMMDQYSGNRAALKQAVRASVEAHNATISALREEFDGNRDAAALALFDRQVGRGEQRLGKLEGRGLDTGVPAATLDEIGEHRDPLAAALASDDRGTIRGEREEIRGLAKEFRQQVRTVAKEQAGKGKSGS